MTKVQWWVFILFTIPVSAIIIAIWLSNMFTDVSIKHRVWNMWHDKSAYWFNDFHVQETLNIK